jgi:hypothetical protein
MKKITALVSVLALTAVLATGCKKKEEEAMKPTETEAAKPAEPAPAPEAKPAEPAPAGDTAAAGESGIPSCDAYLKTFEKYMACDKVPQQAKDASKQGIDAMKQSWAQFKDPNVPAEAKKAAGDACTQGEDAIKQSAQALGCTL